MERADKIMVKVSEYAKYIYVVHILLAFCVLLQDTIIMKISMPLAVVSGGIVLLYRLIHIKKYIKYPFLWMYILFVVLYIVTSVLNLEYGYSRNLKVIIWMTLQFGTLYLCDLGKEKEQVRKELRNLIYLVMGGTTVINIIGLGMMFTGYFGYYKNAEKWDYVLGFAPWGRLYGAHTDANYGAVMTGFVILAAIYLMRQMNKKVQRVILGVVILLNALHLSFSGSRTGLIALMVSVAVYVFIYMLLKKKAMIKAMVFAGICVALIYAGNHVVTTGYNWAVSIISEYQQEHGIEEPGDDIVEVGREEELSGDISNRRFDLWTNALQLSKTSPLLGVSFGNIISYCSVNLPDSYLFTNDYMVFDAFHNMFMDLLASQGILGVVLFLVIIIVSLRFLFINRNRLEERDKYICCFLFSAAAGMVVSSLFVSEILYVHNQVTVVFWTIWGLLFYFFESAKRKAS